VFNRLGTYTLNVTLSNFAITLASAILLLLLGSDVKTTWKLAAATFLGIEAAWVCISGAGLPRRIVVVLSSWSRSRKIRKYDYIILELYRLGKQTSEVIGLIGEKTPNRTCGAEGCSGAGKMTDMRLGTEENDPLSAVQESFSRWYLQILKHKRGRPWRTEEFVEAARTLAIHISLFTCFLTLPHVKDMFGRRIQTAGGKISEDPIHLQLALILETWKPFVERLDQALEEIESR